MPARASAGQRARRATRMIVYIYIYIYTQRSYICIEMSPLYIYI